MRARFAAVAACAAVFALGGSFAEAAPSGDFTLRGTVEYVVDGDTIAVSTGGKVERVRLIGVDTPERGRCYSSAATAAARRLADGRRVMLKGDASQATRDRYGRLLAYVWLPGGKDLGYQLLAGGYARVYVYDRPFARLSAYRVAESRGRALTSSLWTCGRSQPPPPPPGGNCDPSYPGVCIAPYSSVGDLDCADVPYTNFRVVPPDPHGFDGDGDGVGCED